MARVAADPIVELELVWNPSPLVHAILALVLLIAATVLEIYKPFGMTPCGASRQTRFRQGALVATTNVRHTAGKGRGWEYAIWILALAILGLIIVSHLMESGSHGH